jgi:nucleoid DNA-binding protein
MNKNLFEEYASLKQKEKELVEKIKELAPKIMEEMGDNEEVELGDVGRFIVGRRRSWVYPQTIQEAEENIKVAKRDAEKLGDAEYAENPYLIYKNN